MVGRYDMLLISAYTYKLLIEQEKLVSGGSFFRCTLILQHVSCILVTRDT